MTLKNPLNALDMHGMVFQINKRLKAFNEKGEIVGPFISSESNTKQKIFETVTIYRSRAILLRTLKTIGNELGFTLLFVKSIKK